MQPTVTVVDPPVVVDLSSASPADLRKMLAGAEPEAAPASKEEKPAEETPAAPAEAEAKTEAESGTDNKEQEQSEEQHNKGKGGFQRRIDKLVRQNSELERQLAEKSAAQPAKPVEAPVADPSEPKLESFDSYDAYVSALTDYRVEQKFQAREAAEAKAKADADAATKMQTFQQKAEAARVKHDDFDDVVSDAPMTAVIRDFLMESDQAGEVAYALASNRAELARISSLPPIAQVRALAVLESKFTTAPETKATAKPLPKPPANVGGGAAPVVPDVSKLGDLPMSEFPAQARKLLGR